MITRFDHVASRFPQAAASRTSAAIAIARVVCILGIVYVHAWTGLAQDALAQMDRQPQGVLHWVLMEVFGRSATPLLSMISGWLAAGSVLNRKWPAYVAGKTRTILIPMLLWNALAILLISIPAAYGLLAAPQPVSAWWVLDEVLCLATPGEINVQMAFLRDLFVCLAAAPLLARLPSPFLIAIAAAAAIWSVAGVNFPLLLRPAILVFFVAGMLVRRGRHETRLAAGSIALTAAPFLALAGLKVWLSTIGAPIGGAHPSWLAGLDLFVRFAGALCFWRVAWNLAGMGQAAFLLRIEPYAFLMFSAHVIMIWLAAPLFNALIGPLGSPLYPFLLLIHPLMALGATLVLGLLLTTFAPPAAFWLSGGRLAVQENLAAPERAIAVRGTSR